LQTATGPSRSPTHLLVLLSVEHTDFQLHLSRQACLHTLAVLVDNLHAQASGALGAQVVIYEILWLEVALADAAGVVLAQVAAVVAAAGAPETGGQGGGGCSVGVQRVGMVT
jgi:hypothetical protein